MSSAMKVAPLAVAASPQVVSAMATGYGVAVTTTVRSHLARACRSTAHPPLAAT